MGAGESATSRGVPAEDRWMGGGSATAPKALMEEGDPTAMPYELTEATRHAQGINGEGRPRCRALGDKGDEPPCPGAGGRLEVVLPQ